MAQKGVCELCGFADDSYRIEENGAVMRVCKFCHDGHLERMGLSPDADKPLDDAALALDIDPEATGIDIEGLSGEELLRIEMELAARKQESSRVPTLDPEALDTLLAPSDDDKRVLGNVRQRELRRKKRAAEAGEDELGEDYKASEELIRSGEELQRVMEELENVTDEPEKPFEAEAEAAPLIAKIVAPKSGGGLKQDGTPAELAATESKTAVKAETAAIAEEQAEREFEEEPDEEEKPPERVGDGEKEFQQNNIAAHKSDAQEESEMSNKQNAKKPAGKETRENKEELVREKIHAAANQTIDDERIKITSPEVALSKDTRPKTNLDVAISEYSGGVRFLDAFKYVMHKVSYAVFLGLIVLAVSTVLFIRDGWKHGLIVLGGGIGSVALGFLLLWYLSHCYELDRRALLLRIRQQEILFESMNGECYRELRTKFTVIKALGWLLNKLTVLFPLLLLVGGNVAAVIAAFLKTFWLFPVLSAATTVAAVLTYYLIKFSADWIAYALDRERNQQIQQQTLLDILDELRKGE